MKKIICLLSLLVLSFPLFAQSNEDHVNHSSKAFAINSHYVKSFIGLNLDSLKRLPEGSFRIETKEAPADSSFVFNGIAYKTYVNILCDRYQPELISLLDIKNIYAPEIHATYCVFMVNDVLLTKDLKSFKIDKNYIHTINVIRSREIEKITGGTLRINLIMIYTRTDDFMEKEGEIIFWG